MFSLANRPPGSVHIKGPQSFEWGEKPQQLQRKETLSLCVHIHFISKNHCESIRKQSLKQSRQPEACVLYVPPVPVDQPHAG